MLNCLNTRFVTDEKISFQKIYDLKGCADDKLLEDKGKRVPEVHKRFYSLNHWCNCYCDQGLKTMRANYFNGKIEALYKPFIPITGSQKELLMKSVKADVAFLTQNGLMDYSLLVGVLEQPSKGNSPSSPTSLRANIPIHTKDHVVLLSIIDYLQVWTAKKTVARMIKSFELNKATIPPPAYGKRFLKHFEDFIVPIDLEDEHKSAAEKRLTLANKKVPFRCFPFIRK